MSLQVWLPLNQGPENVITDISNFGKESGISITADTNGWYKIADSSHTSSRWGIYKDFYVKSNTTYTLNVYAKSTTGVTANVGIQSFNGYTSWPIQRGTYNGSSEKLITFTWTTAATDNYARVYLAMNPSSTVANNYVFYKGVEVLEAPEIKNQGLADVGVINNGATYSSTGGKIGGCYNFDGSDDGIRIDGDIIPQLQQNNFSICFWLFSNDAGDRSIYIATTPASDWGFSIEKTTANKLRVYWQNNPDFNSSLDIPDQQWCHIAVVIKDGNCYCYKNGEKLAERTSGDMTPAKLSRTWIYAQLGRDTRTGSTVLKGKMNDFRWYDHALSQKEVKKLSKGLVLHYPLNRRGLGQENNIKTSIVQNRGCSNFVYNSSTNEWTMTCPTGSGTWGFGIVLNDRTIAWKSGESWLVSMEVYTPRAINWKMDINNKPDLADISSYTGNDYDDQRVVNTNGVQNSYQLQIGWNKLWFTQRAPSTYGLTNYSTNWGIITTNETSAIDIKIKNIKGEIIGSGLTLQPTTWCPNSSDALATMIGLNDNIEYDTSGFNNHGTRIGTFTYSSDTPKYHVSTQFDTTSTKIKLPVMNFTGMANSYTFAWWQYNISTGNMPWGFSDGNRLNCYHCSPLCWNTGDGSSNKFKDGSTTIAPTTIQNGWHHMVVTGDGTETKLYIDGAYKGTATTYKPLTGTQIWISGWDSGTSYTFSGSKECDFRIYATALSASDVLELYNNKNF